ncbi:tryptophan synthase subunit alpha [Bordetella genomosp. 11]|uniref:Tryptophan synthase alpha chain n=1 Tax=Bordetella genomosp. 11 TaxID=1416808 RepID=A0A261UDR2_9BORD|nr:tryptophan synthase subunit alpha [Bordetella genomosp. 11]OZI59647.1 tryptophan synthase subunit alpha [Bordetella genomosp. 11]
MTSRQDRIAAAFSRARDDNRAALIPYVAAGDPSPASCVPLMHALVEAGADVIELGVPFSDPMADGPVIQRATERAIAQGMSLRAVLDAVKRFRIQDDRTPVVLMGYANPIERMGQAAFADAALDAGVDGVLVVDYPPEEVQAFADLLGARGIAPIFLIAPTTTDARIQAVGKVARGYAYYVSLKGVTGAGHLDTDDVARRLANIRRHVHIPIGVGFGIRDAASAQRVAQVADAVVIGSKLIETMEQAVAGAAADRRDEAAIAAARQWLGGIRSALAQAGRGAAAA